MDKSDLTGTLKAKMFSAPDLPRVWPEALPIDPMAATLPNPLSRHYCEAPNHELSGGENHVTMLHSSGDISERAKVWADKRARASNPTELPIMYEFHLHCAINGNPAQFLVSQAINLWHDFSLYNVCCWL